MFYSDSNIFHLRICPYYRSYILPVLIFKALHFYHVHNYGSSPTFVSIFMGTVYFTIKNSVKCFQNVFTGAQDIKKTANISGFKHFGNYSNSIVPGGLEVRS